VANYENLPNGIIFGKLQRLLDRQFAKDVK